MAIGVPCDECGCRIELSDDYCTGCGERVSERARAALETRRAEVEEHEQAVRERSELDRAPDRLRLRLGRAAMAMAALLHFGSGMLESGSAQREASVTLANLAVGDPQRGLYEVWPTQILLMHWSIAAILLAAFVWARRSPLAAHVTIALAYAALLVGNASGLLMFRVFLLAALTAGAVAVLSPRRAQPVAERQ